MSGAFQSDTFQSDTFQEGGASYSATAADSLSSLTEAPSRVGTFIRSVTDSLATLTESPSRVGTFVRTAADSLATLTEAVVAVKGLINRTAADSLATLTETVSRTATMARTVADSLATLTETVSRAFTGARTVADSLATLTESVIQSTGLHRAIADSISSISTSVSRVGTFGRAVHDLLSIVRERVAGTLPFVPVVESSVTITIGGVDFTDDVLYETARFVSQVNGKAGDGYLRIRDETASLAFVIGEQVVLKVNGVVAWRGFISQQKRVYIAPALNVTDFGVARFIDLELIDVNILFQKRFVFKKSHPADVYGTLFPAGTDDATAIADLVANFLDLSSDTVDTTTYVESVGVLDPEQQTRAYLGGDSWGQAMDSIAMVPAAIYYLSPTEVGADLVYTDVDTPNAPFGLSDQPDGITTFGYREMEVLFDGSNLANDVMCWGIGYGPRVFKRDQDSTSQSVHGLWQFAETANGVYKQATIDRIADSILNGTPTHHRGQKDDREAVIVTTMVPGLLPAQKVPFLSNVFGYSNTLPIRKMEVTFVNPTTPKYALTMSLDIDSPWGFVDQWMFKIPRINPPPPFPPILPPGGCVDCIVASTFDDFNRTVSPNSWGTSSSGYAWTTSGTAITFSVDGSSGLIVFPNATNTRTSNADIYGTPGTASEPWTTDDFVVFVKFKTSNVPTRPGGGAPNPQLTYSFDLALSGDGFFSLCGVDISDEDAYSDLFDPNGAISVPHTFWVANTWYILQSTVAGGVVTSQVYTESGGPGSGYSTVGAAVAPGVRSGDFRLSVDSFGNPLVLTVYTDYITATYDRCANFRWDSFSRRDTGNWGTPSFGLVPWDTSGSSATVSVDGSTGVADCTASAFLSAIYQDLTNPLPWAGAFTMSAAWFFESSLNPNDNIQPTWSFVGNTTDESFGAALYLTADPTDQSLLSIGGTGGGADYNIPTNPPAFTAIFLKLDYTPGGLTRGKVWWGSTPEPDWQVSRTDTTTNHTETKRLILGGSQSYTSTQHFVYLSFDYTGKPCYDGGPTPAPVPQTTSSGTCETGVRITSTQYGVSIAFVPGSTQVYIDGFLQRQGVDYTEDSGLMSITFGSSVSPSSLVTICYSAATAVSGGAITIGAPRVS